MTRRGDEGETDLLFGRRVGKAEPRIEALGAIDELNTVLGLARCVGGEVLGEELDWVQGRLVGLMGELATLPEDAGRYVESGMPKIRAEEVDYLEGRIGEIEEAGVRYEGWARPGASGKLEAAYLDQARAVCRRAERRVWEIGGKSASREVTLFLNRLSDYLWLMARREES